MLSTELSAAGYSKTRSPRRPGQYAMDGQRFTIFKREFRFPESSDPDRRFTVEIAAGRVADIRDAQSGEPLSLVRLDPAEIASIYPLLNSAR